MSQLTDAQVADLLKSGFPPRAFEWMEAESGDGGVGSLLDALATEINADGFARVEQLAKEVNPATAEESLPEWEAALALDKSKVALYGTTAQRQAQVVARLRETGTPTPTNIQAACVAIAGPTAITILEHSRTALDAALQVSYGTATILAGASANLTWTAHDNAPISTAGVRLAYNGTGGDASTQWALTGPNATTKTWQTELNMNGSDHVLFGSVFSGAQLAGTWTLHVDNTGGGFDVQIDALTFYADGIGRDAATGADGLGARIFEFNVTVNEALVSSNYDRSALCATVGRWTPAHCIGRVALYQTTGALCALADNTNALADMCVCGG